MFKNENIYQNILSKMSDIFAVAEDDIELSSHSLNREEEDELNDTLDDVEVNDIGLGSKKKTRGKNKVYIEYCSFKSLDKAFKLIKDKKIDDSKWTRGKTDVTGEATKTYFTCCGQSCTKKIVVEYRSVANDEEILEIRGSILISDEPHEHIEKIEKKNVISQATLDRITELCLLNHKPERILQQLKTDGLEQPNKVYLNNLLKKIRNDNFGVKMPTYRELKTWCEQNSTIPDNDDDKVFVGNFSIDAGLDDKHFRIFLTTKRLMSFTKFVSKN